MMSKVDQLEPRPAIPSLGPDSWVAASAKMLAERRRRKWKKHKRRWNNAIHGRRLCVPYDRVSVSAEKAPTTRPVKGPAPPPWSGSKSADRRGPLKGEAAEHDDTTTNWGSTSARNDAAANGGVASSREDDDADDPSCFVSVAVEGGSWSASDEGNEDPLQPRWATNTAAGVVEPVATKPAALEASKYYWKMGGSCVQSSVVAEEEPVSATVADEVTDIQLRKSQPQLCNVWIPQQRFQGKALIAPKQRKDAEPADSMPAVVAIVSKKGKPAVGSTPPGHRVQRNSPLRRNTVHSGHDPEQIADEAPTRPTAVFPSPASIKSGGSVAHVALPVVLLTNDDGDTELDAAKANTDVGDGDADSAPGPLLDAGKGESVYGRREDGKEYFDYAKRFSWQNAAGFVAQADDGARPEEQRSEQQDGELVDVQVGAVRTAVEILLELYQYYY